MQAPPAKTKKPIELQQLSPRLNVLPYIRMLTDRVLASAKLPMDVAIETRVGTSQACDSHRIRDKAWPSRMSPDGQICPVAPALPTKKGVHRRECRHT